MVIAMPEVERIQLELDTKLADALKSGAQAEQLAIPDFVLRAIRFYLYIKREQRIREQYEKGYGAVDLTELALEMKDWESEQVWPER